MDKIPKNIRKRQEVLLKSKKVPNGHHRFDTCDLCRVYEYMGCHKIGESYVFRVAAPRAHRVCLTGDFDDWSESYEMRRVSPDGIYEIEICADKIAVGSRYKYKIQCSNGDFFKADPYAQVREIGGLGASVVTDDIQYEWNDRGWMIRRASDIYEHRTYSCLNIYEICTGKWRCQDDGAPYTFSKLAFELAPYLKQMGYTHVLISPAADSSFELSQRQVVHGYFAPCEKYGGREELVRFTDTLHNAGLGVIFRLNMSCFPKDEYGLCMFDGGYMYENTCNECEEYAAFDLSKRQAREYLISNAVYYVDIFHSDGLMIDNVPDMLAGSDGDIALDFLGEFSHVMRDVHPEIMLISDGISGRMIRDGKACDMFDMYYDTRLTDNAFDCVDIGKHGAFDVCCERVTNDISGLRDAQRLLSVHDITCRLHELFCDEWNMAAVKRMLVGLIMALPCGKHGLMGDEICCTGEAACGIAGTVDWSMLDKDMNAKFQLYCSDVNNFLLAHAVLWGDSISCRYQRSDKDQNNVRLLTFVRGNDDGEKLYVTANFSNTPIEDHRMYVDNVGTYGELFNSDDIKYGGSGVVNTHARFVASDKDGNGSYIRLRLPPMAVLIVGRTDTRQM